ncbi:MAG TPA: UDP-N-acetylglucosamine 2-epimerase (non-hydrolyzing) [Burkholderiales bacterium]|nr:UDP-N-acetylglucosamine 2-epimerase (non-hydrolyzing) [Burkholderiales bacterium]
MMAPYKLLLVAGARPNFMKVAPICWAVERGASDLFSIELVHTGQHYDAAMSDGFFRDLGLPAPDVNLGVGSASHAEQTARVMIGFEQVLLDRRPDAVVVVGDVNSTAACALVASKIEYAADDARGARRTPRRRPLLAHVEAGLRSGDRTMPEEINRIVTDAISDLLLTTCRDAAANLAAEGASSERVRFVGNPMIDSLRRCLPEADRCPILADLGLAERPFGLCTLHRPSNVDRAETLAEILRALGDLARDMPILLPLHPRTRARIADFGLSAHIRDAWSADACERELPRSGVVALAPLSYVEMLKAMKEARFVLTDSGGVQEETTALGVPCVTLRANTERPVTIAEGTNVLAGVGRREIVAALAAARRKSLGAARMPELWDGAAGPRIVRALADAVAGGRRSERSVAA